MTTRTLAKGEEFLMAGMESGDEYPYVTGLFRATDDLDLSALEAEFDALGREAVSESRPRLQATCWGVVPADVAEAYFQRWLVEQGHVERVPVRTLWIGSNSQVYRRPGSDLDYLGFASLKNELQTPVADPEMEPVAGPRP